jgi:hypothetical protein
MKLAWSFMVLVLVACSSTLSSAQHQFRSGNYAEAKALLESAEHDSFSETEVVQYELYRGLVHHALGDRVRATQWLTRANMHATAVPSALNSDDRTRLKLALEALADDPR